MLLFGPKKSPCLAQFDRKAVISARRQSLELTKDELDLVILGNLQAGRASSHYFQWVQTHLVPALPGQ